MRQAVSKSALNTKDILTCGAAVRFIIFVPFSGVSALSASVMEREFYTDISWKQIATLKKNLSVVLSNLGRVLRNEDCWSIDCANLCKIIDQVEFR
jgi:hypothetical protein